LLLWMYPIFIAHRNIHTVNEYATGNPSSNSRCDVGSDPTSITFLN
jgi:hypothetical protein